MQINQTALIAGLSDADNRQNNQPANAQTDEVGTTASDAVFSLAAELVPAKIEPIRNAQLGLPRHGQPESVPEQEGVSAVDASVKTKGEVAAGPVMSSQALGNTPPASTQGDRPADGPQAQAIPKGWAGEASPFSPARDVQPQPARPRRTVELSNDSRALATPGKDAQGPRDTATTAPSTLTPPPPTSLPIQATATLQARQLVVKDPAFQEVFTKSEEAPLEFAAPQFRDAGQQTQPLRTTPDMPRIVSAQLAEVARSNPDKPVELTLNPEELGRLRLTFRTDASSMNVILQVERPETLDLMRRHIEQLAQDMHELGYDDVSFTFHQQGDPPADGQSKGDAQPNQAGRSNGFAHQPVQDVVQISVGENAGMDIRI
ncbi:flagellar hook-length control protein FliK [Aliiroseovarius sp. S1339]|uniref:flagellar hook-length control protein FliK n=1 Tax=Aliiroseovarius sp. S1339 TaxID=2936990 RepID=UPI0020BF437B|nr:flagellar hook-length control protein FliK [Aliiroseovarius sp. S1339]MCK8463349.1 flagellar hook-length control protein FliK [Aliiroseovarius sp. S1339]